MRMGSLDVFIESTRSRIRHGDAKLILIDDLLADFYTAVDGDPPLLPMKSVMPGAPNVPPAMRSRSLRTIRNDSSSCSTPAVRPANRRA